MDSDGRNKTQITDNAADDANPDWAPFSDQQLAFESDRNGTRQIYVVDLTPASGGSSITPGAVHQVTFGTAPKYDPSWANYSDSHGVSLQGPHDIAYSVDQGGRRYLDVAEVGNPDGPEVDGPFSDPATITMFPFTGDPGGDTAPNWSPIGLNLVYASTAGGANEDVYGLGPTFAPASLTPWQGPPTRLTTDPARDTNPDWEPFQQCSVMSPRPPLPGPTRAGGGGGGGGRAGGGGGGDRAGGGGGGGRAGGGGGGGSGGGGGGGDGPRAPGLAIRSVHWHASRVSVGGRATRGLQGRVRVAFACGHRRSQHTQKRVHARSGRFGGRLRAPRACRRARRGVVAAAYGGDHRYRAQKVTRRIRRR
jgi:hypothetical protein